MRTHRFCDRCQGVTEHHEPDPPGLRAALVLFRPVVWLIDRWPHPPSCLRCLRHDRGPYQGDDWSAYGIGADPVRLEGMGNGKKRAVGVSPSFASWWRCLSNASTPQFVA
jgi:hypothetical protein